MGDRTGLTKLDRTNGYEDRHSYMRAKHSKLAQQNDQIREVLRLRNNTMRTHLFKGISINVNGRTQPTADELKRLILLNGGEYHPYYRYQITKFMIATNLSSSRIKQLRPDDRVVKPEWITDSIREKCLLPYQDYQLYADQPRGKNGTVLAIESDSSNHAGQSTTAADQHLVPISESYTRNYRTNRQHQQNNSSQDKGKNRDIREMFLSKLGQQKPSTSKKKSATMDDFVVRGASKPNQFIAPTVREQKKHFANICGLTQLDEIICLLNEWVGCPEGITDEDIACVTKYFYDLMSEKDYHNKFYEIIYALRQSVIQHGERRWIDLYNNLATTLKSELNQNVEASHDLCQLISLIDVSDSDEAATRNP